MPNGNNIWPVPAPLEVFDYVGLANPPLHEHQMKFLEGLAQRTSWLDHEDRARLINNQFKAFKALNARNNGQ